MAGGAGARRRGGRRDGRSNGGRAGGGLRYRDGGRDADAAQQRAAIRHRAAVPRSAVRAELRAEPRQPPAAAALSGRTVPRRPPSPEGERCHGCLSFVFRRTRIRRRRRSSCGSSGPCTVSALCTSFPTPTWRTTPACWVSSSPPRSRRGWQWIWTESWGSRWPCPVCQSWGAASRTPPLCWCRWGTGVLFTALGPAKDRAQGVGSSWGNGMGRCGEGEHRGDLVVRWGSASAPAIGQEGVASGCASGGSVWVLGKISCRECWGAGCPGSWGSCLSLEVFTNCGDVALKDVVAGDRLMIGLDDHGGLLQL